MRAPWTDLIKPQLYDKEPIHLDAAFKPALEAGFVASGVSDSSTELGFNIGLNLLEAGTNEDTLQATLGFTYEWADRTGSVSLSPDQVSYNTSRYKDVSGATNDYGTTNIVGAKTNILFKLSPQLHFGPSITVGAANKSETAVITTEAGDIRQSGTNSWYYLVDTGLRFKVDFTKHLYAAAEFGVRITGNEDISADVVPHGAINFGAYLN